MPETAGKGGKRSIAGLAGANFASTAISEVPFGWYMELFRMFNI